MTPEEKLIQELRRKIKMLEIRNAELERQHTLDLAEITRMRRLVEMEEQKR